MNKLVYLLFIVMCWGCTSAPKTEKRQHVRDRITDVTEKIREIKIDDVLIGGYALAYLLDDYLIIGDFKSYDQLIHIFDKNTFAYLGGTAYKGQGPGEIANIGHIAVDESQHKFYVTDHGKQQIFSYDPDSLLADLSYLPHVKMRMKEELFPADYEYFSDTLCIGLIIEPIGHFGFNQSIARWNMTTGEITPMKYAHPEVEKKRVCFAVSIKDGIYVEGYSYHDLMTICSLDGELIYEIYGRNWNNEKSNKTSYYGRVAFYKDKIVATYLGSDTFSEDSEGDIRSNFPTQFHIYDINGDYLQTLETGHPVTSFCFDKENNRIIMSLDGEIQFAYLDLEGII